MTHDARALVFRGFFVAPFCRSLAGLQVYLLPASSMHEAPTNQRTDRQPDQPLRRRPQLTITTFPQQNSHTHTCRTRQLRPNQGGVSKVETKMNDAVQFHFDVFCSRNVCWAAFVCLYATSATDTAHWPAGRRGANKHAAATGKGRDS